MCIRDSIQSVHQKITYQCDECQFSFTQEGTLKCHIQNVHQKITYQCNECHFSFHLIYFLYIHVMNLTRKHALLYTGNGTSILNNNNISHYCSHYRYIIHYSDVTHPSSLQLKFRSMHWKTPGAGKLKKFFEYCWAAGLGCRDNGGDRTTVEDKVNHVVFVARVEYI